MVAAGAAMSLAAMVSPASGQTWANNLSGGTQPWATGTNWVGGVAPVSTIDTALVFNYNFSSALQTSQNNIGAVTFNLNSLTVNNDSAGGFTISAGTSPSISFNTSSVATVPALVNVGNIAATISSPVALVNTTNVSGAGLANLTLSGILSGAGGLNLNATGPGVVALTAANTLTGSTVINSGNVAIGGASPFGAAANTVTINGGTLRTTAAATIAQGVILNTTLNLTGGVAANPTFTGVLSGVGGISFRPTTSITAIYQGANTFTGSYFAQPFGNAVPSATLSGAAGAFLGVSSITLATNQSLSLDNSVTNNNNRLNDAAPIAMHRATLAVTGNAAAATLEAVGDITFSGGAGFTLNANNVAQNVRVVTPSITRSTRGSLVFAATGLGGAGANTSNLISGVSLVPQLIGGGGGAGTPQVSIIPWALATNVVGGVTNNAQLVTYDAAAGFRPLVASEYNSAYLAQTKENYDNIRATAMVNGFAGTNSHANALVLDTPTGAASVPTGFYMKPGSFLRVASGAVMDGISGGATATTLPSIITGGTIFNKNELILHIQENTAINANLAGGALTKAGNTAVIFSDTANTTIGDQTVNGGSIDLSSDAALGDASNKIVLNGGNVTGIRFAPSMLFGTSAAQSLTIPRNVTLGASGGGLQAFLINTQLNMTGVISGSGPLLSGVTQLGNTGVLKLSGANTYTGHTVIFGNLAVDSDANLGTGTDIVMTGGFLRNDGVFTTSKNLMVTGSTVLLNNGANSTFNGVVNAQAAALVLIKGGTNTATFTATNPFNGSMQIGQTAPAGNQDRYVTGGSVTLNGANGAFPSMTGISVLGSAILNLDNTAANNTNRFSGNLTLGGGSFNFLGNGGAASTETVGTLSFTGFSPAIGNGTSVVTISPGAGQSAVVTASDLTRAGGGTLLIRGTNLGGAIGANTANLLFNTTTTGALAATNFTNGCIGGVVVDSSLVGNGTDLANYVPGTGVVAATYGAPNTFGAAVNSDLTANNVLLGATSANAIRMSEPAGGIDTGGFVLTVGVPAMILANGPTAKTIAATGGGSVAFPAASVGTIWNNSDLTIGAPMTGLGTLNKSGTGILTLNATSAGTTTLVSNGTLRLGGAAVLPATSALVVGSQDGSFGTLDLNGFAVTANSMAGLGNIINNTSLTLASPGATTFGGTMSGTGSLTISGSMTINSGTSTYTGDTIVRNSGTLTIGANQPAAGPGPVGSGAGNLVLGDATTGGTITFGNNVSTFNKNIVIPVSTGQSVINVTANNNVIIGGTVTMSNGNVRLCGGSVFSSAAPFSGTVVTYTGVIQDGTAAGGFDWFGGNINLWGNNTFTGGTDSFPGTSDPETMFLGIGHNNALGTGTFRCTNTASGNLRADNGARNVANGFYWTTSSSSRLGFVGVNQLTLSGAMDLGGGAFVAASPASVAGPRVLNVINAADTVFSGVISGTTVSTLTKTGGGRLIMSNAANTFAGNVTVTAGSLLVNGNNLGGGTYTVSNGGLLGGNGSIVVAGAPATAVNFAAGSVMEPGASIGTLSVTAPGAAGVNFAASSLLTYELTGANTVGSGVNDLLAITGNLSIPAAGQVIVNIIDAGGFMGSLPNTYTLITYTGALLGGTAANFVAGFMPLNVTSVTFDTTTVPGSVLVNVVPTPGSVTMLGLAGLFAARRRRR